MTTETDYALVSAGQYTLNNRIKWVNRFAWLAVEVGAVVGLLGVWKMLSETPHPKLSDWSTLGGYLQGTVASLWALGGLLLIYASFLAQRQQMRQQEAELEDQKRQFEAQQESIKRQNFETAFFNLLNLHSQNAVQMRDRTKNRSTEEFYTFEGRTCLLIWWNELVTAWNPTMSERCLDRSDIKVVVDFYQFFYNHKSVHLGHYFRTLYHVFKFISDSDVQDKRRYSSLARAQLASSELLLLFYNCLTPQGQKFKPLVEKFGLFEHIEKAHLLDASHEKFYTASAYQ